MKKKSSRKKIIAKLDKVFSQWIRAKHMNDDGFIECYTCRVKKKFNEIQAGHFMSRKSYSTRWNEKNVFPQCIGCNMFKCGMQYEFGKRLDEDFGKGTAEAMQRLSKQSVKIPTYELENKIEHYQDLLNSLEELL
jgi:hypothetical protein